MKDWQRETQLAGMSRVDRLGVPVDRGLERLFAPDGLSVPLEGRAWLGESDDGREAVVWARPFWSGYKSANDAGILESFARLSDAKTPAAFLTFALRYGPLRLCARHELPLNHPPPSVDIQSEDIFGVGCVPLEAQRRTFTVNDRDHAFPVEAVSIDAWRGISAEVAAALHVAAHLHRDKPGARKAWERLLTGMEWRFIYSRLTEADPSTVAGNWLGRIEAEKQALASILDTWIRLAALRPVYAWDNDSPRPEIQLGGGGVFGAVVRHLVFSVAKLDGLAMCAGCGRAFTPTKRRPAKGRQSWCSACGKRAADRAAQQRRRDKARKEA